MRGHRAVIARGLAIVAVVAVVGCSGDDALQSSPTTSRPSASAPTTSAVAPRSSTTGVALSTATPPTDVALSPPPTAATVPSAVPPSTTVPVSTVAPLPPPPRPVPAPTPAGPRSVAIVEYVYAPDPVEVRAGSTVTWTNRDDAPHTATDPGGAWDTGALSKDQSATVRFDVPGTYEYICALHPTMRGGVVVIA